MHTAKLIGGELMTESKWLNINWRVVTKGAIALYIIFSFVYMFLGQPNADEGWYLYASRLVFEGNIPYQDFAFTQTPLLPYIYGVPQFLFRSSVYLGRLTSVALSITNLLICIKLANKYAGERGAGLAALLLCSFTFGIYYVSIVKTYSLVSLFFTLTFFVLSSNISDTWKYPLAVVMSFCAAMVRLSALIFFITILFYSLAITFRRRIIFFRLVVICLAIASGVSLFLYANTETAKWNLVTYHISQWGDIGTADRISKILFFKIPDFIKYFSYYTPLLAAIVVPMISNAHIRKKIRPYFRENLHIPVVVLGLSLFSISHLGTGDWQLEYFVPAIISFLPILAISFEKISSNLEKNNSNTIILWCAVVIALLVSPIRHNYFHIDLSGNQLPLEEIRDVSNYITRKSKPSDHLLVLEALWVAVDSERSVLPGMTMAQFSYQDISKKDAESLMLVNGDMILEYIKSCSAKVVVLTDHDWLNFKHRGYDELIKQELLKHYKLGLKKGKFGQGPDGVYVYLCNTDQK